MIRGLILLVTDINRLTFFVTHALIQLKLDGIAEDRWQKL